MRHANLNQYESNQRQHTSTPLLQEILDLVDNVQVAAMVGQFDADCEGTINMLSDIQRTVSEAIMELEERMGFSHALVN